MPLRAWAAFPEPQPAWADAEAELRFLFTMPHELRYCLVKLPADVAPDDPLATVRAVAGDLAVPSRILHADEREVAVMLDTTYVAAGSAVAVYARGGDEPAEPAGTGPLDPAPLFGEVRRVAGQDYPETWAAHLFQRRRMREPFRSFRAVSFDHAGRESNPEKWREEWTRSGYCVDLATWFRVSEPGVHRFAVKGANSIFLLWGEAETPLVEAAGGARLDDGNPADDAWVVGPEVRLQPGVHRLRLVQVSRRFSNARAGWIPPGAGAPVDLPVERMLSGQRQLPVLRQESRRAVVQAGFEADVRPGYRFRGVPEVFAPVRLKSLSLDWLGGPLTQRWTLDGRELAEGAAAAPVLTAGAHRLGLLARNGLGFQARAERLVRVPAVAAEEYRIAGSLQGVPAICFPQDRVWPDLWVTGSLPPEIPVRALLWVRDRMDRTERWEADLALQLGWGHLRGTEFAVGDLAEIGWEIRHGGVRLAAQTTRFLRQPFERLPGRVFGNELHHGAERLVLVVRQAAAAPAPGAPVAPAPAGAGRIVCLDSTLAPPGWYSGREEETFHHRLGRLLANGVAAPRIEGWDYESLADAGGESLRALAPLAALQRFRRGDRVVVSLGLEAYADREPVGAFERRLAALCGLLREAVGAEVLLATPPPFGDDRRAIRPYAEAVLRVADAYGLEVADIFSAFGGHACPQRLYDGLRVTGEGQALAAGVVARALRGKGVSGH